MTNTTQTHSNQWGIMNPSPRVSVCRSGRKHSGQESHQCLARKDCQSQGGSRADGVLSPAGQSLQQLMPREISMAWSSTLVCGVQLSQQWSGACLRYTLKEVYSTFLGFLISVLEPLMASEEFSQEPICEWYKAILLGTLDGNWGTFPGACLWVVPFCRPGCSDHVCRYVRCVSLPDVSALT